MLLTLVVCDQNVQSLYTPIYCNRIFFVQTHLTFLSECWGYQVSGPVSALLVNAMGICSCSSASPKPTVEFGSRYFFQSPLW